VPRWNLERKLVAGILVLFLVPTVIAGGVLLALYRRGALADPHALIVTVLVGFAAMMAYLGMMAHTIGRSLVRTLQEIQRGTELMATVNPDYRHQVRTGDEMESVAEEINRMADRVREARLGLEAGIARATRDLHVERSKLSAILEDLDEGVVVAGLDGRITLANRAAADLLGTGGGLLGRSLFEFVDREKLTHFGDRLQAAPATVERFTLHPAGGLVLGAGMTCFVDQERQTTGFILGLRDVSRPARQDEAQLRLLADAARGLRGSLSSIRSLSESLLSDAVPLDASVRPLVAAILAEAVRLSALAVEMEGMGRLGFARAPVHFEEIAVADLVAMSLRRLAKDGSDPPEVMGAEPPADLPSIRGEVSALSAALASLLHVVGERRDSGATVWVKPARRGGVLQIEVGAPGSATVGDLEMCLDRPISLGPAGWLSVREIVHRHAGEVWAYAGPSRLSFRLTLPAAGAFAAQAAPADSAPPAQRLVGAGLASGFGDARGAPARPRLYDFSLIEQMERHLRPADRERRLDDLMFVVFDTETTGLRPDQGDRIISLAGVRMRGGLVKRAETFDALVQPNRSVTAPSIRFHGITDAMLANAPPMDLVFPAFVRFADGAMLVGHEVWFDLEFLALEAERLGLPPLGVTHAVLDTCLLSAAVHGDAVEHTLDAVAERFGVVIEARHSALGDALATAEVFARLLPLLRKRGIATVGQAVDAARAARGRGPGPHGAAEVRP
jgi:DNA polymerase III subunit epsilon